MAPGRRQGQGCWTCRLRHKRCDSVQPVCGSCRNLEITCYTGEARPPWMDGGTGQKRMSEKTKARIKQNAFLRRERRLFIHEDQGIVMPTDTDLTSYTDTVFAATPRSTSRSSDTLVEHAYPIDSVTSTVSTNSLGTSPALQSYHKSLLSSNGAKNAPVRLEAVVGCQNWALVAVGNISALCAWKRDAKRKGNFSVVNLVKRAGPISQALEEGLTTLDIGSTRSQPTKVRPIRLDGYYSRHDRAINSTSIANVTRIWAHAARIYLSVGLSGWQANCTDTQTSVAKVLSLLQTIESPAQLRNLSWPICIAGCLALPSQEAEFRRIVENIGPFREFGTALNTMHIMETVWSSRDTIDGNVWEFASYLNILGSSALLI